MMSSRSTLKLDLKNLTPKPAAPHIGRIGLVIVSVFTMVSAIASINSPSASTAMVVHYDKVQTKDLIRVRPVNANPDASVAATASGSSGNRSGTPGGHPVVEPDRTAAAGRPRIHLAMLAPSPHPGRSTAVVNHVEPDPLAAAVVQHQPDDLGVEVQKQMLLAINATQSESERRSIKSIASSHAPDPVTRTDAKEALIANVPDAHDDNSEDTVLTRDKGLTGSGGISTRADVSIASASTLKPATSVLSATSSEQLTDEMTDLVPVAKDTGEPVDRLIDPKDALIEASKWQTEKVRKKDTLSEIFTRLGLSSKDAFALADRKDAKALTRIRPGQKIVVALAPTVEPDGQKQLDILRFSLNKFDTLVVTRNDGDYDITTETREPEVEYRTVSAEINSSLLGAASRVDIPYDVVYELAGIFGWQIDFAKNIQPGDKFSVIYEHMLLDDEVVGHGQVVAAELVASGKTLRAVRHVDENNRVTYYAPDGEGIQGSFLRSPIKFAPVTSKFSNRRLHPIHKTWKAHKGVDYGAPMKTPIRATGDGVVKFAGKKRGYGNVAVLSHGGKYSTLYAHMNGFKKGLTPGSRVKQGDVIGYVGKTGWATGPHLHYEFRINGKNQNPLTVELPKSLPIDQKYRRAFIAEAGKWVNNLERSGHISLAENRHK